MHFGRKTNDLRANGYAAPGLKTRLIRRSR